VILNHELGRSLFYLTPVSHINGSINRAAPVMLGAVEASVGAAPVE